MARPQINGTVVRRVELYCDENGSDKDYVITLTGVENGYLVYSEHGPHGRLINGKKQTPSPVSLASATSLIGNLMDEKIRKKDYRIIKDDRPHNAPAKKAAPSKPKMSFIQLAPESRALVRGVF